MTLLSPMSGKVTRAIAYLKTAYKTDQFSLPTIPFLAEAVRPAAAGTEAGWTVKLPSGCPPLVIAYNARHLNSAGALMFTASNPAPYCGIGIFPTTRRPAPGDY